MSTQCTRKCRRPLYVLDVAGNRVALQSPPNGVPGRPAFYRMNFLTGEAIFIDVLGADVVDVALPLDQ